MKVLSLWEPWAILMPLGEKRIETRSWYMRYRGPLLIHAAKRFTEEERSYCFSHPFDEVLNKHGYDAYNIPLGAIVGMVNVVGCKPTTHAFFQTIELQEEWFGNYAEGRYGIICDTPILFPEPIPAKGHQGLWNFDIDLSKVEQRRMVA